jgi:hypothetical protein
MDARGPSRRTTGGRIHGDDGAQSKVNLLVAYFESGRQELISRVSQRDSAVLLFLVAATAIFGVAFGNVTRPAILFAIAPLGLGSAVIYAQHNTLIGQLSYYCGVEVTEQAEKILGRGSYPYSWEISKSLYNPQLSELKPRPKPLADTEGRGKAGRGRYREIPKIYTDRLLAIFLLIVIPGFAGAVIGAFSIQRWWAFLCGLAGALTALWAGKLLIDSALHRSKLRDAIAREAESLAAESA